MGILETGLKVVGSAALGTAGIASTILRTAACATGKDELASALGNVQDKSFETIRDMWTPDEEKTEEYYEAQAERSAQREESAYRSGEAKRQEYERMKEMAEREKHNL